MRSRSRLSSVKCEREPPMTGTARPAAASAARSAAAAAASVTCRLGLERADAHDSAGRGAPSASSSSGRSRPVAARITRTSSGRPDVAARSSAAAPVRACARSSSTSTAAARRPRSARARDRAPSRRRRAISGNDAAAAQLDARESGASPAAPARPRARRSARSCDHPLAGLRPTYGNGSASGRLYVLNEASDQLR